MARPPHSFLRIAIFAGLSITFAGQAHTASINDWTAGKTSASGACVIKVEALDIGHLATLSCIGDSAYQDQVAAALQSAPKKLLAGGDFRVWSPSFADKMTDDPSSQKARVALSAFEASPRISELLLLKAKYEMAASELERMRADGPPLKVAAASAECPAETTAATGTNGTSTEDIARLRAERDDLSRNVGKLKEHRDILASQLKDTSARLLTMVKHQAEPEAACSADANAHAGEINKMQVEHNAYVAAFKDLTASHELAKARLVEAQATIPQLKVEITRLSQERETLREQLASKAHTASSIEAKLATEMEKLQTQLQSAQSAATEAESKAKLSGEARRSAEDKLAKAEQVITIMTSEVTQLSERKIAMAAASTSAPMDVESTSTSSPPAVMAKSSTTAEPMPEMALSPSVSTAAAQSAIDAHRTAEQRATPPPAVMVAPPPAPRYQGFMVEIGSGERAEHRSWNTSNVNVVARNVRSTRGDRRIIYAGPFDTRAAALALAESLDRETNYPHYVLDAQLVMPDAHPFPGAFIPANTTVSATY